jgi:hypothetical protein
VKQREWRKAVPPFFDEMCSRRVYTLGYFLSPLRGWNGPMPFIPGFTPWAILWPPDRVGVSHELVGGSPKAEES